jgi:beta-glucanase (GH16 family)
MAAMRPACRHSGLTRSAGLVLGGVVCLIAAAPETTVPPPARHHLVWHDEFDGTEIDRTKWDFDTGTGFYVSPAGGHPGFWVDGWGNGARQCYTDRHANAFVAGGVLHIRAIREPYHGGPYTSARLRTGGKGELPLFVHRYGRFEFRARLPVGQGYWPALWLLPQDEGYGGWPASGEIDVVEARGGRPDIVQGTLHYGSKSPGNVWSGQQYRLPPGGDVGDWHVYAIDWEPGRIRWSVDGVVYSTRTFWCSCTAGKPNPWPAPFDRPFYVVMNLAVGGQFGGDPDANTKFPGEMLVDYVRVYDRDGGPGPLQPRGAGSATDPSVVVPPSGK